MRSPEDTIRAILDARRLPSGDWRSIEVRAPSGAVVAVFTDPDRSLKQRRIGWHVSAILRILEDKYLAEQLMAAKAAGAVTCRWETLVSFDFNPTASAVEITWHDDVLGRLELDKAMLAAAMATHIATSEASRRPPRG